jgi:hypothetical protein
MSGSPAAPTPPLSPAEMQVLIARAGLTLNPGQVADLVLAWRQIVGLLGMIPRDRPLLDDQAFVFRLPPPAPLSRPVGTPEQAPSTARVRKTTAAAGTKAATRTGKTAAPRASKKAVPPAGKTSAVRAGTKAAARTGKITAPRAGKQAAGHKTVRRR